MKKIALLILPLALAGCASIVDGGDKSVRINSNPPGAVVTISDKSGKEVCHQSTPAIVSLRRNRGFFGKEVYTLKLELPGYYPDRIIVKSVVDGWYAGNILFGGLIGVLIVDPATGAMYTLRPRDVARNLVAVDSSLGEKEIEAAKLKANPPPAPPPTYSASGRGYTRK